jgi:hypothetical protein
MKRRILSFIGFIVLAVVIFWAWNNLGGGQGLMHNVGRNTTIGFLAPVAVYFLFDSLFRP